MHETLPPPAILAVLDGRTVVAAVSDDALHRALHRVACQASRRADYLHVVTPPVPDRYDLPYVRRRPVPTQAAWDGLPLLDDFGMEPERDPTDTWTETFDAAVDAAWAGIVPGPGRRLARGDGRIEPDPELQGEFDPRDGPLADLAPVLDLDAVAGRIVAVDCTGNTERQSTYFLWLVLSVIERAEIAGHPPPFVIGEGERLDVLSRLLGWDVQRYGSGSEDLSVCVPRRDPDAFLTDDDVRDRLARRIAAAHARCTVSHADGLWRAEGDGRTVLAVRQPTSIENYSKGNSDAILFVTVDPGPRTTRCLVEFRRTFTDGKAAKDGLSDDDLMAQRCREAWLTEIRLLEGAWRRIPVGSPLAGSLSEMVRPTPYTRLAETLFDLVGEEWSRLERVCCPNEPERLWAWVHAPGGDTGRRRQFADSFPELASHAIDRAVTEAVDAGRSPIPRLGEILDAPAWGVRRLARIPHLPGASQEADRPDWRFEGALLKALGPDGVRTGWLESYWLARRIASLAPLVYAGDRIATAPLMARLAAGPNGTPRLGMGEGVPFHDASQTLQDFLRSLKRWLVAMSGREGIATIEVAAEYGSLPALWEASRRWHAEPRLSASIGDVPPDATWPVPFAPLDLGKGWTAVAIPDVRGLVAEGTHGPDEHGMEGLGHCVATYAGRCLAGTCVIVSLRVRRNGRTERASTVQLDYRGRRTMPVVVQHQGLGNGEPGKAAVAGDRDARRRGHAAGLAPDPAAALGQGRRRGPGARPALGPDPRSRPRAGGGARPDAPGRLRARRACSR